MVGLIKKNLCLNKLEKTAFLSLICTLALGVCLCNITWVLKQMGINVGTNVINTIMDSAAAGSTMSGAIALILGVTVPAWAAAAAGAVCTTAA